MLNSRPTRILGFAIAGFLALGLMLAPFSPASAQRQHAPPGVSQKQVPVPSLAVTKLTAVAFEIAAPARASWSLPNPFYSTASRNALLAGERFEVTRLRSKREGVSPGALCFGQDVTLYPSTSDATPNAQGGIPTHCPLRV